MSMTTAVDGERANELAVGRMIEAEPVLVDMRPAVEVVPGHDSRRRCSRRARRMPWERVHGRPARRRDRRRAVRRAGATDAEDGRRPAGRRRDRARRPATTTAASARWPGSTRPRCRCSSSRTGAHGNVAFCNSFEGASPKRLNYGVYDEEVRERRCCSSRTSPRRCSRTRSGARRAASRCGRSSGAPSTWATSCTAATPPRRCCSRASCCSALLDVAAERAGRGAQHARLHGRQRLLLPAAVDGRVEGDRRRRPRRRGRRAS